MQRKISILTTALVFFSAFFAHISWGASYDMYVDNSYDGDEEGTSEKPYKKISAALEKADDGNKIYIKNGTYEEALVLENGIELYGQDKNKTIIKGALGFTVKGRGDNVLKDITISGGNYGVVFEKRGEVENCIIKNVAGNAIEAVAGSSELKVTDSKMIGNIKGIYIQMGRVIMISNNEVLNSSGEGLDIREKTKGLIQGNLITGGKEPGIEIVIGSSNVTIKNNTINKNKASGIATQFYPQATKTGAISIQNNTIRQNGKFGVDCNAPSGGHVPKGYWNSSLNLIGNTIENNATKAVAKACKLIGAITEEEEKENQITESADSKTVINEELKPEDIYNPYELSAITEMDAMKLKNEEFSPAYSQSVENLEKRGKLKIFFIGPDYEKIDQLKQLNEQQKSSLARLQEIKSSSENDLLNEIIDPLIQEIEKNIQESDSIIENQENKFSLFGWFFKLF